MCRNQIEGMWCEETRRVVVAWSVTDTCPPPHRRTFLFFFLHMSNAAHLSRRSSCRICAQYQDIWLGFGDCTPCKQAPSKDMNVSCLVMSCQDFLFGRGQQCGTRDGTVCRLVLTEISRQQLEALVQIPLVPKGRFIMTVALS